MATEEKQLSIYKWAEKAGSYLTPIDLYYRFDNVDEMIKKSNGILGDSDIGTISYKEYSDDLIACQDACGKINAYIYDLSSTIDSLIDSPFYKSINEDTEALSNIKLENYMTDNLIGITQEHVSNADGIECSYEIEKQSIGFADFLGSNSGEYEWGNKYDGLKNTDCVDAFADMFKEDYNKLKNQEGFDSSNVSSVEEYLDQLSAMGEFDHKLDCPFLNFLSGALDITIIKPIIEACTGQDLITKEQLSEAERALKAGGAVIDIVTLGYGLYVTEFANLSRTAVVKVAGKYIMVSAAGDLAGYTAGYVASEMELPTSVCIIVSILGNAGVSATLSKSILNNSGTPYYQTAEFREKYAKYINGGFDSKEDYIKYINDIYKRPDLSAIEKAWINAANFSDLTAPQRIDLNVLGDGNYIKKEYKFSSWEFTSAGGKTQIYVPYDWPDYLGLDTKKNIEVLSTTNMPKIEERIGSLGGNNFSPLKDEVTQKYYSMNQKSIGCYIDNTEFARHIYSVDTDAYIKAIDCIANKDVGEATKKLNELIKSSGLGVDEITEGDMRVFQQAYTNFATDAKAVYIKKGIDFDKNTVFYGLIGKAKNWKSSRGGAGQINTAIKGWMMNRIGVLEEIK